MIAEWIGRNPGTDLPTVYLEHNAPRAGVAEPPRPLGMETDVLGGSDLPHKWLPAVLARA